MLAVVVLAACDRNISSQASVLHLDLRADSGKLIAADIDRITRAVALQSGHIAFVEPYRRRVVFVDTATGARTVYGRDGRGPGEFSTILAPILRMRGDSVVVVMQTGRLFQVFTASNGFAYSRPSPIRSMPREFDCHTDDDATIYCRVEGASGADGPELPPEPHLTEAPVIRFRLGDLSADTVWSVPGRGYKTYRGDNDSFLIRPEPLYPMSGFGVSPDGSLWRALGLERRVEVSEPGGAVHSGSTWDLEPRPVTSAERDSILEAARAGRFGDIPLSVHGTWPVFWQVLISPSGTAWVRLARHYGDNRYRVFDSQGRPTADVDLRVGDRIVGFSESVAYVLREHGSGTYSLVALSLPTALVEAHVD